MRLAVVGVCLGIVAVGGLWLATQAPGAWPLAILLVTVAVGWAGWARWGRATLKMWSDQALAEGPDEGPSPTWWRELVPHGNAATRAAWSRRHPWRAGIWFTLFFGVTFVLPLSLLLARSLQQALWVGAVYVIVTPIGWRVLYDRL